MLKRKPKVAPTAGPFVLSATSLRGIDLTTGILRTSKGLYAGAIKVRGIDIEGLRPTDQETVYAGWGAAEQACELPRKIVLCETRPDLSSQRNYILSALSTQQNAFRKSLLERQLFWIDYYQKNQKDQTGYVIFFSKDAKEVEDAQKRYIQHAGSSRISASVCDWKDALELSQTLLSTPDHL